MSEQKEAKELPSCYPWYAEALECAGILLFCLLAVPIVFVYDVYKWIKEGFMK